MQRTDTVKHISWIADKWRHRITGVITTLLLALSSVAGTASADVKHLTFATIKNSVNSQISFQVIREAYRKLGIEVDADYLPASRSLMMAGYGQYDGELYRIAGITEDYPHLLQVPTPVNRVEVVAFCRTDGDSEMNLESLKNYRLGVRRGVRFNVHLPLSETTQRVDSNRQLFNMLEKSRIDIALVGKANGLQIIREMEVTDITPLATPLLNLNLYHYVHSRHKALIPKLNKVLQDMHLNGRIAEIRRTYLNHLLQRG
ncbi:substrate-binding periplasmic protein [Aliamphritea spongicola]|uniref:substrate-binding periplasmic protein n=1 Tax=Aliamphritea spongicola TaxID=707589 RepID=UPI00196B36CD|nr:transporter substrate-binding domain-containing protein [Aliamphritea spongicola]MBN3561060.1 transporter substrate-binding domain-containing protein [Aliamphritea spongicola]